MIAVIHHADDGVLGTVRLEEAGPVVIDGERAAFVREMGVPTTDGRVLTADDGAEWLRRLPEAFSNSSRVWAELVEA